jgi:4,5-DOPA dioxygenase extradiol
MARMPVAFVSHAAPVSLEDLPWMEALGLWGSLLPEVREILVLSAHWVTRRLTLGPSVPSPLVYDFYGFPDRFSHETYPAPVSASLVDRLSLLEGVNSASVEKQRGLDHGMWVPLKGLFPDARIPVLGLSLPGLEPKSLFELGQRLATLRDEGVLILCSGGMTHNLRELNADPFASPASWAEEFEQWVMDRLVSGNFPSILEFEILAPHGKRAHPTTEHFAPIFVALGAASDSLNKISFPVEGFRWGTLSLKSVQFG